MVTRYAFCCVAEISAETMNRFNEEDTKQNGDGMYYDKFFVFVDRIDKDYNEGPPEVVEKASSSTSPFIGKTPQECHALLKDIHAAMKSDIDLQRFAIMDERSMEDHTVLIVDAQHDYGSVRADFGMAIPAMMCWMTGHSTVTDDISRAEETPDNVYRWSILRGNSSENNQS